MDAPDPRWPGASSLLVRAVGGRGQDAVDAVHRPGGRRLLRHLHPLEVTPDHRPGLGHLLGRPAPEVAGVAHAADASRHYTPSRTLTIAFGRAAGGAGDGRTNPSVSDDRRGRMEVLDLVEIDRLHTAVNAPWRVETAGRPIHRSGLRRSQGSRPWTSRWPRPESYHLGHAPRPCISLLKRGGGLRAAAIPALLNFSSPLP
jgi:hypothetical protein